MLGLDSTDDITADDDFLALGFSSFTALELSTRLRAEGIDIFQALVLPRAAAFALAAFTLGVVFVLLALVSGFVTGSVAGVVNGSIFGFLDAVLRAMSLRDLAVFPIKLLLIGLVVALACCATGLAAGEADGPASLMPRGFTRGITGILAVTVSLSALL